MVASLFAPRQASQGAQASESTNSLHATLPHQACTHPHHRKAEQAAWVSALSLSGIPDSGMVVSSALSRTRGDCGISPAPAVQEIVPPRILATPQLLPLTCPVSGPAGQGPATLRPPV